MLLVTLLWGTLSDQVGGWSSSHTRGQWVWWITLWDISCPVSSLPPSVIPVEQCYQQQSSHLYHCIVSRPRLNPPTVHFTFQTSYLVNLWPWQHYKTFLVFCWCAERLNVIRVRIQKEQLSFSASHSNRNIFLWILDVLQNRPSWWQSCLSEP